MTTTWTDEKLAKVFDQYQVVTKSGYRIGDPYWYEYEAEERANELNKHSVNIGGDSDHYTVERVDHNTVSVP